MVVDVTAGAEVELADEVGMIDVVKVLGELAGTEAVEVLDSTEEYDEMELLDDTVEGVDEVEESVVLEKWCG